MCKKYRRIIGVKKKVGKKKEEMLKNRAKTYKIYDPVKIAKQLTEWADLETSINFVQFCAKYKYLPELIWRIDKENEEFSDAYSIAKMTLAERRERLLNENNLNYGAYQRYQKMYDPFLKKEETDEKNADAARAKGIAQSEKQNFIELAKLAASGNISQGE